MTKVTPVIERFMAKVRVTDTCWLWTASRTTKGYARLTVGHRRIEAHRWGYEYFVGLVPDGLELDHLCRVRHCVNPAHLDPVTHQVNCLRGDMGGRTVGSAALNALKTHCPTGHQYDKDNTRINPNGSRVCRTCRRLAKPKTRRGHTYPRMEDLQ